MPSACKILGPHRRLLCGRALGWDCLSLRVQRLRRSGRSTFTAATTEGERTAKLGTPEARESKVVAEVASTSGQAPGYPLETPGQAWGAAAAFAYSFAAVMVFNDQLLPEQLRSLIFAVFRSHQNIVNFGVVAVAIHVAYVVFVVSVSKKRGYNSKATSWWAVMSFVFGFLGVRMFLDKTNTQTTV